MYKIPQSLKSLNLCFILGIITLNVSSVHAQEALIGKTDKIVFEIQQYPTGSIPSVKFEMAIDSRASIGFHFGHNIVRHRDLGKHNDERGSGYGFSLSFRKHSKESGNCLVYGARTDLWFNSIDWSDLMPTEHFGNTNVTVLQPTLVIGYQWTIGSPIIITHTISFGAEINISEKGEPVGEGAIGLLGIEVGYVI